MAGLVAGLAQLPPERKLVVGLDGRQAQALSADSIAAAGKRLQVGVSFCMRARVPAHHAVRF